MARTKQTARKFHLPSLPTAWFGDVSRLSQVASLHRNIAFGCLCDMQPSQQVTDNYL